MIVLKILKTIQAIAVVIGLGFGGWAVLAGEEEKELKKLEGEWTIVRAEQSGNVLPEGELKAMSVSIKGAIMTIKKGTHQEVCDLVIDSTTEPKSIDFRPQKFNGTQVDRGIYELKGDQLTLCWGGEKSLGGRTGAFKTTKGGGQRLLLLKRSRG